MELMSCYDVIYDSGKTHYVLAMDKELACEVLKILQKRIVGAANDHEYGRVAELSRQWEWLSNALSKKEKKNETN